MPLDRTRIETLALATTFLVLLATVGAIALVPPVDNSTPTELALLNENGKATRYPTALRAGESGETTVRVTNNDRTARTYTVVATYDGERIERRTVAVGGESSATLPLTFTARDPGRRKLAVRLYRGERTTGSPERSVRIWVTVRSRGGGSG